MSKEWECGRSEEEKKGDERLYDKNVGGGTAHVGLQ
jgi:hypothetical protein